jgi:hypothetical protein
MTITDYNGTGKWSKSELLTRYVHLAADLGIEPRDLTPMEHIKGDRHWIYPVMDKVIEGIDVGDAACIHLGIEFIEEDAKFAFGKTLKANTARALRRATLSDQQKQRIRKRVFHMLGNGHTPREFREYAKLVRKIGFDRSDLPSITSPDAYVKQFQTYFENALAQNK